MGHFVLSAEEAAARYQQGFHFVNCGADIVAVTAWMSGEMARLRALVDSGKAEKRPNGTNGTNGVSNRHKVESSGYV